MSDSTHIPLPLETLTGSLRDYRDPKGPDIFTRVEGFFQWQNLRRQYGFWPYSKSTEEAPQPFCTAKDDAGRTFTGINFASQDYLGLASHPAIKEAAIAAVRDYGVHSAGSAAFLGNTKYSLGLQATISDFLRMNYTVLYPTGWAAGYGVIKGLIRPDDHIVMDALAHSCLQDGAHAATRNVHLHGHLDVEAVRRHLKRIRARDAKNGILVVTEGLFSMDSDTPDIGLMQELCREFRATLLVDVAHDLGCIGEDGTGHIGLQQMLGAVDIVMGSFSKSFASNGGFVSCKSRAMQEYLRYFSSSGTFSNALSPIQAAVVSKAFEIIRSEEGRRRRAALMENVLLLRTELQRAGMSVIGNPSAIVCVTMGAEGLGRIVSRLLPGLGVVANLVEFPAVPKGNARFRLQVMASHGQEDVRELVVRLRTAVDEAQSTYRHYAEAISSSEARVASLA